MKKFFLLFILILLLTACDKDKEQLSKHANLAGQQGEFLYTDYASLSPVYQKLVDSASYVMSRAYNPYSKFHVGAALLADDGEIITGTNFENAAYGSTICAERAAILRANSEGKRNFKAIAIIGKGRDFDSESPIAPCGACRQVISEVAQLTDNGDMEVIMSNTKKTQIIIARISDLLPLAFGPKDLQ